MEAVSVLVERGTARAACPVRNSTVLRCVFKTKTLQMNQNNVAHIAHPTTLLVHTEHGYLVAGPGFCCTPPESRRRCLGREESEGRCGIVE